MITVYLSSTFRDLQNYRADVLHFFGGMKDRFRVLNMEDYTAEDRSAYSRCMADVDACQLYILLIGKSYGSIAKDPTTPGFNPEGYSYTHFEYLRAKAAKAQGRTKLLIFKAADNADLTVNDPDGKLKTFCDAEVDGMLAGMFTTSLDLQIQINRALGNLYNTVRTYDERLAYKCDRNLQSNTLAMKLNKLAGPLRSIMLYGKEDALCRNFVNKVSVFNLSLDEKKLIAPVCFEDFLADEVYESSLDLLLYRLYDMLQLPARDVKTEASLLEDIQSKPDPTAVVIDCYADDLEEIQMAFMRRFLTACRQVTLPAGGKPLYLFFNIIEKEDAPEKLAEGKLQALVVGLADEGSYNVRLPRLGLLKRGDVKNWLLAEITTDAGTALKMMSRHFAGLPEDGFSMEDAYDNLSGFLSSMNAGEAQTEEYINLY